MVKYYEFCPSCQIMAIKEDSILPKRNKVGTDGYGQPVKFTNCECGSTLKGYLELGFYTSQGLNVDNELLAYLRSRINFYYERFSE